MLSEEIVDIKNNIKYKKYQKAENIIITSNVSLKS